MATHKLGGIELVAAMSSVYSTSQLFDFIEVLDVYDAIAKEHADEIIARNKDKYK